MLDFNVMHSVLATVAVAGVIFLFKKYSGSSKVAGKRYPPSLPSLPLVGSLPFLPGGMDVLPEFFMKTAEKLGPVFTFYSGSRLAVILNGMEAITDAMVKHGEAFADRPGLWIEVNCLNKSLRGLGFAHYTELFKKYHKLSLSILKEFGHGASKITEERILLEVENLFEEFRRHNGRPLDPKLSIIRAVSGVIISILFGRRFRTTGNACTAVIDNAADFVANMDPAIEMIPLVRFLPMYRRKIATMVSCHNGLMKGIEDGIALNKSSDVENTFRCFREKEGPGYDHQDLIHILRDLCLGGGETVTTILLWGLVELANHPEVQSRMQRQIDEVISGDRYPSLEDREHLPYTEAFTLELMRRHTPSPLALPHATLKDTTASGYFVPGGSLAFTNVYGIHMDPKTWKDPENFRPERFLDADNNVVGKDRVIPFGAGRRLCIGELLARQELFLFLASLVQQFEILPPEDQSSIKVNNVCGLIINPSDFEVRLIPRKRG